jgi:hypothetical protein
MYYEVTTQSLHTTLLAADFRVLNTKSKFLSLLLKRTVNARKDDSRHS